MSVGAAGRAFPTTPPPETFKYPPTHRSAGGLPTIRLAPFLLAGVVALVVPFDALAVLVPPPNDDFHAATALTLPAGAAIDLIGATREAGEPSACLWGETVWYSLTLPASGMVEFTASAHVTIGIFRGADLGSLARVDCREVGPTTRPAHLRGEPGEPVHIQLGAFEILRTSAGDADRSAAVPAPGELRVAEHVPVPGDLREDAILVPSIPATIEGTTAGATLTADERGDCDERDAALWYRIDAGPQTLRLRAAAQPDSSPVTLALFRGSAGDVVLADCGFGAVAGRAGPGEHLLLRVMGAASDGFVVNLGPAAGPANDFFADAVALSPLPATHVTPFGGANAEAAEPASCWVFERGPSAWYSLALPAEAQVEIDTAGTDFPHEVTLFAGDDVDSLEPIGCWPYGTAEDPLRLYFTAAAGAPYRIRVASRHVEEHASGSTLAVAAREVVAMPPQAAPYAAPFLGYCRADPQAETVLPTCAFAVREGATIRVTVDDDHARIAAFTYGFYDANDAAVGGGSVCGSTGLLVVPAGATEMWVFLNWILDVAGCADPVGVATTGVVHVVEV